MFGEACSRYERLIYIAEVAEKLTEGQYYRRPKYARRPDAIYRWRGSELRWSSDALYHTEENAPKDVGEYPDYASANVLVSRNFKYFGANGRTEWKERYPAIRRMIEALGQGERVHHLPRVRRNLLALRRRIWSANPGRNVLGPPTARGTRSCDR